MENKKRVPARRFKEFQNADPWEQRKLSSLFEKFDDGDWIEAKDQSTEGVRLVQTGNVGVTDFIDKPDNKKWISEETFEQLHCEEIFPGDILISRLPEPAGRACIVPETGTRMITAVDCTIARTSSENSPDFVVQCLSTPGYFNWVNTCLAGGTRQRISRSTLADYDVMFPSTIAEQKAIGVYFNSLDQLVTLHQRKLDKVRELKKAYLNDMFPKEGEKRPKLRFPGFTDDWEQRKLGDEMNVTSVKRILQSDWTDKGIRFLRARDIVSAFKNEEPADHIYISKEKYEEYSALSGKVTIGDMLVTGVGTIGIPYLVNNSEPVYFKDGNIIWFQNEGKLDGDFFYYFFCGQTIQRFIKDSAGIGTVGTYTIESGKKTPISIPSTVEQEAIGRYFRNLDSFITLHQRKLDKLKELKKAYLNEMFV